MLPCLKDSSRLTAGGEGKPMGNYFRIFVCLKRTVPVHCVAWPRLPSWKSWSALKFAIELFSLLFYNGLWQVFGYSGTSPRVAREENLRHGMHKLMPRDECNDAFGFPVPIYVKTDIIKHGKLINGKDNRIIQWDMSSWIKFSYLHFLLTEVIMSSGE